MQNSNDHPPSAVLARTPKGSFRTDLRAGAHAFVADEPAAVGGSDLGPTPYDYLAAALASCTSMTLMMYAARKGLTLDAANVAVSHRRIHAEDCEDCKSESGRIHEFERVVTLEGELTEAETTRLMEIADMCPVHKTLSNEIRIRSRLAEA